MNTHRVTEAMTDQFREYLIREERSQATVEKYLRDIRAFMDYCKEKNGYVDKTVVMAYKEYIRENYKPSSVNSMLASVNGFCKFMGWQECCVRPLKVQRAIFCQEERMLKKEEYFRLLKTAKYKNDFRMCMIMETLGSTGMRVSELPYVTVEALKQRQAVISCKGKIRKIFLPEKLCQKLKNYIKKMNIRSGSIFVTRSGKPMNRSNIWAAMKKICQDAGVDPRKVFPHNFRHLFAVMYYEMEKDIAKLADLLGHSCVETTRIYILTDGMQHRKQIERLNMLLE